MARRHGVMSMGTPQPSGAIRVLKDAPNLRELTTQTLREAILKMHFKPKQRLTERELCEGTGVSRTCVREALRHLEAEGLVERVPNRGIVVASVSVDEARQIYEVRAALETAFARLFAERATDKEIEGLKTAYQRVEKANGRKPVATYVAALDAFYDTILAGARNEIARASLSSLRARMSYLRALTAEAADPARKQETLKMMRAIVEAAERRDGTAMAKQCRAFVERSAEFAIAVLGEHEEKSVAE
jgi:GntR family transcriptional regulator, trigonelline degradation regulator